MEMQLGGITNTDVNDPEIQVNYSSWIFFSKNADISIEIKGDEGWKDIKCMLSPGDSRKGDGTSQHEDELQKSLQICESYQCSHSSGGRNEILPHNPCCTDNV